MTSSNEVLESKDNKSYAFWLAKAKKYNNQARSVTPEILQFVHSIVNSNNPKTRHQAIEYIQARKLMPYAIRGVSISFLCEVNNFLSSVTDGQLKNILRNPKDKMSVYRKVEHILELMLADEKIQEHKYSYIKSIKKLIRENTQPQINKIST